MIQILFIDVSMYLYIIPSLALNYYSCKEPEGKILQSEDRKRLPLFLLYGFILWA
jgi:hypothetical protein